LCFSHLQHSLVLKKSLEQCNRDSQEIELLVTHIYREGNRVADLLANHGLSLQSILFWQDAHEFIRSCSISNKAGRPNFRFSSWFWEFWSSPLPFVFFSSFQLILGWLASLLRPFVVVIFLQCSPTIRSAILNHWQPPPSYHFHSQLLTYPTIFAGVDRKKKGRERSKGVQFQADPNKTANRSK